MSSPASRVLGGTLLAAIALAVVVGVFVARTAKIDRYYMPGELGHVRVARGALNAERAKSRKAKISAFRDFGVSDFQPAQGTGYLTRAIGLRTAEEQAWGRHNGVTAALNFSHHLATVFPRSLFATHPEFFPLVEGKRFDPPADYGYWNPDLGREDVAAFAAKQAAAFFTAHPGAVSYSLGVNDGLLFGESEELRALVGGGGRPKSRNAEMPKSRKDGISDFRLFGVSQFSSVRRWFRGRPDYSPLVFTFMNRAAADLARAWPDKYLGCLAYYWAENAPPFAVDPHVVPFLTADRAQSYDPAFKREEFDLQARWAAAVRPKLPVGRSAGDRLGVPVSDSAGPPPRLGLYDYLDGYGFLVPRVPIHAFAEHIRHAHAVGFTDYYGESSRNWGLDGPMPWVIAQLLQDPERDVDALLDEYYANYFGPAAAPMRAFFDACERQWMAQAGPSYWLKYYRNQDQAVLFPPEVRGELRGWLDQALAVAQNGGGGRARSVVADRVRFVADSFGLTERYCAFQEARAALATRTLRGELAGEAGARRLAEYRATRSGFIRYAHTLREKWPLAFYPINYDDWLRDDPAYAAEAALGKRDAGGAALDDVLVAGDLRGEVQRGRRIAGLQYGADVPSPWQSRLEPVEHGVAELVDVAGGGAGAPRALRLSGQENATVYQWVRATPGVEFRARMAARGRISASDTVLLTLGWLDAQERPIGHPVAIRLPDGEWPEWVTLRQAQVAPANAAWAGVGLRVQHQVGRDWVEVRSFALEKGGG